MSLQSHSDFPRSDYLLVLLFVLPALFPLVGGGLPTTHEGLEHLLYLSELDTTMRGGAVYPRWFPSLYLGYGSPVLAQQPPLAYYLALPLLAMGGGGILSAKTLYAAAFLLGALLMLALSRPWLGRLGSILAAVSYTYLPYHLGAAYVQGSLPTALAYALLPAILFTVVRMIQTGRPGMLAWWGAGLAAALLLDRGAVVPAFLLSALGVAWFFRGNSPKRWAPFIITALLAGAASALYWVPALAEMGTIVGGLTPGGLGWATGKSPWIGDLAFPTLIYPHGGVGQEGFAFGAVPASLVVLGLAVALMSRPPLGKQQRDWMGLCGSAMAVGLVVVAIGLGQWMDWRLLFAFGAAGLIGAIAIVPASEGIWHTDRPGLMRWFLVLALAVILAFTGLSGLPARGAGMITDETLTPENLAVARGLGSREPLERTWDMIAAPLPVWVKEMPWETRYRPEELPPAGTMIQALRIKKWAPLLKEIEISTTRPAQLCLQSFYSPAWKVKIDAVYAQPYPWGKSGLLTVDLPAGNHLLKVRHGLTPARWIGLILSLATWIGVAAWMMLTRRRRVLSGIVIALAILIGLWGWHSAVGTIQYPQSSWVVFGATEEDYDNGGLVLVGYDVLVPEREDDPLSVDLYWLARSRPAHDYMIRMSLEEEGGRLRAEEIAPPLHGQMPASYWPPGHLVRDSHRIELPAGLSESAYTLYLGVCRTDCGTPADLAPIRAEGTNENGVYLLHRIPQREDGGLLWSTKEGG